MERNFSENVREIISFGKEEAGRLHNNFVSVEHIFLGMLRNNQCVATNILYELMRGKIKNVRIGH